MTIQEICASFDVGGKYIGCTELTSGNINNTYRVVFIRGNVEKKYIVQRINKNVFKQPERVMDNIIRVTDFVRERVEQLGLPTKKFVLRAFLSKQTGKAFIIDDNGDYWRCYRCIENSITYDTCEDLMLIERVGQAFGRFQKMLDGFDASSLHIAIPDFHNTVKRFESFHQAINEDKYNRASKVEEEINKLLSFEKDACLLQRCLDDGTIPLRVTHNDTKCNNVSFDKTTGEALAVLDLDTVMPGAIAHDFGDAIRFVANSTIEDDPNTDNVSLDIEKYTAFTKGFVSQVRDGLTDLEKQTLNLGVFAMTVELAVRFLTDYLCGDKYFKTKHPGHNLERARNQIALAEDMISKRELMSEIIKKFF